MLAPEHSIPRPLVAQAMLLQAQADLDFGNYAAAAETASKAIEAGAGFEGNDFLMRAEMILSISYHFLGKEEKSQGHLHLLERFDTTPEKFVWRAQAAMATGRDKEALAINDEMKQWTHDQHVTAFVAGVGVIVSIAMQANQMQQARKGGQQVGMPIGVDAPWQALFSKNVQVNLEMFQRGHLMLNAGRLPEARTAVRDLLGSPGIDLMGGIYWATLFDEGRLHEADGKLQLAIDAYRKSIDAIESMRSGINSEASRIGFIGDKQAVYQAQVDLMLGQHRVRDALTVTERSKARVLVEMLAAKDSFGADLGGSEAADAKAQLSRSDEAEGLHLSEGLMPVAKLASAVDEGAGSDAQALAVGQSAMRKVLADGQDARRDLGDRHPRIAPLIGAVQVEPGEIQAALHEDEVLVSYYYTKAHLYAFLIAHDDVQVVELPRENLERDVATLHRELSNPTGDYREIAASTYARLVAPVRAQLGNRRVVISPYGVLHYVPFGALVDGTAFLGDDMRISYLPSASTIKYVRKRGASTAPRPMMVLGNPDRGDPEHDLQLAGEEARVVGAAFDGSLVLTGEAATKERFEDVGGQFRILHFATHGEFDVDDPLKSALWLSAARRGAPATPDDALTVDDLYGIKLDADLVTLSACESGVGKVRSGDEVIGLVRAFLFAGARRVVSSRWRVDDTATSHLMGHFYAALKRPTPPGDAMREAATRLRGEGWTHPYFWAAFSVSGEP